MLYGLNCSSPFTVSAILIDSSALLPKVPVSDDQLTLFCRKQDDTEVRSPWFATFGLKLFKPQLSCLENEFLNESVSYRLLVKSRV